MKNRERGFKPRRIDVALGLALSIAIMIAGSLVRAQSSAQNWETAAGGKMAFDVASVKQNTATSNFTPPNFTLDDSDSYPGNTTLFSATVRVPAAITFAYKLSQFESQAVETQLAKWATSERFDIQARAANPSTKDQMRLMMQALLADRFKLAAHFETNVKPVYALAFVKAGQTGPQLRPYSQDPPCDAAPPGRGAPPLKMALGQFPPMCYLMMGVRMGGGVFWGGRNVTMQQIAKRMSAAPLTDLGRPVADQTGLSGTYDFLMNYAAPNPKLDAAVAPDANEAGEDFNGALKEQLGLKLDSATAPIEALVIDHIEEPTPN